MAYLKKCLKDDIFFHVKLPPKKAVQKRLTYSMFHGQLYQVVGELGLFQCPVLQPSFASMKVLICRLLLPPRQDIVPCIKSQHARPAADCTPLPANTSMKCSLLIARHLHESTS